mmetsp:Transcript_36916/g.82098  ORF Transcript_36916/g.82098 Transcript_36916/m.82098 type:complete len:272 (-) Transcript_36916:18-833(-)
MGSTLKELVTAASLSSLDENAILDQPTSIEKLISCTPSSILRAHQFFLSWSGVLTLAYTGFSPALTDLKDHINTSITSLPKENAGSKWPKTSLGALKEGVRLTPAQTDKLLEICRMHSGAFQTPQAPRSQMVVVDNLSVIFYECRSLERVICRRIVPLMRHVDSADPSPSQLDNVHRVMSEAEDPNYWFHVARDGSRESHYKGTALGVTLVHELSCFSGKASETPRPQQGYATALPGIIRSLKQRVDAELPGLYTWFEEASLHVTIRALMG